MKVRRITSVHGSHEGRSTLEQRFLFADAHASSVADALLTAPLVGERSIFGKRPGREVARDGGRSLRGFSPAPGFCFDVDLTPRDEGLFVVGFTQPDRATPYLEGEFTWTVQHAAHGALLDEQINTAAALAVVDEPLDGPRPSLRRRLFFLAGHRRVMQGAARNLAALLAR